MTILGIQLVDVIRFVGILMLSIAAFIFIVYYSARLISKAYFNSKKEFFTNFWTKFKKEIGEL